MFPLIATLICVYLAHSFTLLGSPAFVRNFSTQNNDNNPHVLELPDGELIFAHESSFISGGSAATDMVVYRLDNRGIVKWSKRIGTTESNSLTSITATTDGNIALLGSANYDPANTGWHLTVLSGEGSILQREDTPTPATMAHDVCQCKLHPPRVFRPPCSRGCMYCPTERKIAIRARQVR